MLSVWTVLVNASSAAEAQFARALPGYHYVFPRDHGAHRDYRTEWWYFTGNLRDAKGRAFGFELTFFRNALLPPGSRGAQGSPLVANDVYLAHFAISDIDGRVHETWDRIGRPGFGQGSAAEASLDVRLGPWRVVMEQDETMRLVAREGDGAIDFTLRPARPLVIHGVNGVHQKAGGPGQASHYYSYTRLDTSGRLTWRGKVYDVTGLTWMDHEFGSDQLETAEIGWDWFALQLNSGQDLMLYQLRRKDGSYNPHSSGTRVEPGGKSARLPSSNYTITTTAFWTSPHTQTRYPMGWTLRIPGEDAELIVTPAFEDQEMLPRHTTGTVYWEGAVRVSGRWRGRPVSGQGYVELVGYAHMPSI